MLRFGLFGAGRIGLMHARNISQNPAAQLASVYDVDSSLAQAAASECGAKAVAEPAEIFDDRSIDAVFIASSTNTHVDLINLAVDSGKAVLCEKPIDLDIARVEDCRRRVAASTVAVQIGFNRRFDPGHCALREAVAGGEIGRPELVVLTSRDPAPPPVEYLRVSGGLFRDMMIHDFDLARFITAEEPVRISAMGSSLVDPAIGELGDVDTAMVVMEMQSGALCHINCSRRSIYGYDQRVEAFGAGGMLISGNQTETLLERHSQGSTSSRAPLLHFFIERYAESYKRELSAFIASVQQGNAAAPTFEDGRRALLLANAARESLESGAAVKIDWS